MPGYSGTPLAKKLGIKEGSRIFVVKAPRDYSELIAPMPSGVRLVARVTADTDVIHLFTAKRAELARALKSTRPRMAQDAAIWVSWPKQSAKVPTDITEDTIRDVALPLGLVDVKVCAVDEIWSGLKLVVRKELRNRS